MQAMVLKELRAPLKLTELSDPRPGPNEIRVKVGACGVCRTDLHVVDGDLPGPKLPIIPGHEIVGRVDALGAGVRELELGQRVGVPWLGHTDGTCDYCLAGHENLCDRPLFTGFTRDGGYAGAVIADARYSFPLGDAGDGRRSRAAAVRRSHRLALTDLATRQLPRRCLHRRANG
jgi:propanol-preferring alcohol dehydrogenase